MSQPRPWELHLSGGRGGAERIERSAQLRDCGGVPCSDEHGPAVEENVRGPRWLWWRGSSARGFSHLPQAGAGREPAGEHGRPECLEVRVPCECDVEGLELHGGTQELSSSAGASVFSESDLGAQQVPLCLPKWVEAAGLSNGEQFQSGMEVGGEELDARGAERP